MGIATATAIAGPAQQAHRQRRAASISPRPWNTARRFTRLIYRVNDGKEEDDDSRDRFTGSMMIATVISTIPKKMSVATALMGRRALPHHQRNKYSERRCPDGQYSKSMFGG